MKSLNPSSANTIGTPSSAKGRAGEGFGGRGSRGFSLIEVLLVVGIFGLLAALGLFMSMETYYGEMRRSERDTLVSVLERARSRAMANVEQSDWGVCLDTTDPADPEYHIFEGAAYTTAAVTDTIPASPTVSRDLSSAAALPCSGGGIIFEQLSGNATDMSVTLSQGPATSVVSTNQFGLISW